MLHLQKIVRAPLNVFADLASMSRAIKKSPQDEHVQRALQEIRALLYLFGHRRHSTIDIGAIVDIRLSICQGLKLHEFLE